MSYNAKSIGPLFSIYRRRIFVSIVRLCLTLIQFNFFYWQILVYLCFNVNSIAYMYPKSNKLKVMLYEKYFPTQCTTAPVPGHLLGWSPDWLLVLSPLRLPHCRAAEHGTIGQDGIGRCRDDTIVDCLQVPDKPGYPDPVQRRVLQYWHQFWILHRNKMMIPDS